MPLLIILIIVVGGIVVFEQQRKDLELLALVIWREASGEGIQGMRAVGWSIRNRVMTPSWWGRSYEQVILKPWQYESMMTAPGKTLRTPVESDTSWVVAKQTATEVYQGIAGTNPVGPATHFYAFKLIPPPNWVSAPGSKFIVEIGGHRFYVAA